MADEDIGTATVERQGDKVVVVQADKLIAVAPEMLDEVPPSTWDGEVLVLDSDGEYRYRHIGRRFIHGHEELTFERIPPELCAPLTRLVDHVPERVAELLDEDEAEAIGQRAAMLLRAGTLPVDHSGRRYPWPQV